MDEKQANCRKNMAFFVVAIQIVIILIAQLFPIINLEHRIILVIISTIVGLITYSHAAYSLIKLLNEKDKAGFEKEIKQIKMQCFGYYFSVLLYSIFYAFEFSDIYEKMDRSKYLFLTLSLLLACNLIPPLIFMFMHHKIYTEQIKRKQPE